MSFSIGSLFDGSGGFPLAATLCGGVPKWASEVEPYPIAVTRSRFPGMQHLGDVSKIDGAEVEPVDVVTFGSPCQDLSVAGKRAGLKHDQRGDGETTRSGLFMEAVRIIKEMRGATNGVYPNYALWENVPGAFSSNKGEDFRFVLQSLIKIVEPEAFMPPVPKGGWSYSDCYCGDGWSLAYRVFDAQYWGVPQRRRRIYLVLDLRGDRAGKILFERQGLQGHFDEGESSGERVAGDTGNYAEATDRAREESGLIPYTLKIRSGREGVGKGTLRQVDKSATLTGDHNNRIAEYTAVACTEHGQANAEITVDEPLTLNCNHEQPIVFGKEVYNSGVSSNGGHCISVGGVSPTLRADGSPPGVCVDYIVRRLTPLECARLQGFSDWWGNIMYKVDFTEDEYHFWLCVRGAHAAINRKPVKQYSKKQMLNWYNKLHSDSAEYKMWGNGIALPTALYCMQGIAEAIEKEGK